MPHSLPVSRTIRENAGYLLAFAFSRRPLEDLVEAQFHGEFKQFREAVFEFTTHRAERAALELALLLRYKDEDEQLSAIYAKTSPTTFGYKTMKDGSVDGLTLRDASNKIIHAENLEWNVSKQNRPLLICKPWPTDSRSDWTHAEIDVLNLCVACGSLM